MVDRKKWNSVMQYGQYHAKGLFWRFLYWFSPVPMQTVCTQFLHKLQKNPESVSLALFIQIL